MRISMRFVLFEAVRQAEGYCSGYEKWLGYEEQTETGTQVIRLLIQGKDLISHEYGACEDGGTKSASRE